MQRLCDEMQRLCDEMQRISIYVVFHFRTLIFIVKYSIFVVFCVILMQRLCDEMHLFSTTDAIKCCNCVIFIIQLRK